MRKITKFKRSLHAISPVVATLLMIAIAVVAALVVYAWVTGYIGGTTNKAGNAILIQSITTDQNSHLVAYVQNVGQGDVVVDSGYVNNDLAAQSLSISLTKGNTAAVTTTYLVTSDASLSIKIVTTDGTFAQFTGSPHFGSGSATTYQVVFNLGAGGASMVPSGTQAYTLGTMVAVHALATSGYQFSSWTSTGTISLDSATSASTTAHIGGAGSITANFVAVQPTQNYQVTFNLGTGGSSMTPTSTQTYPGGSSVPVGAVASSGYQFSSWTSTGTISFDSATSTSTIAHVNGAGSITANFIATQPSQNYQVTFKLGTGGSSITPTGTQNYPGGSIVPINAIPAQGYQFSYWASSTTSGAITFGSVTSATTSAQINGAGSVTANFIQIQTGQNYQVIFSTNGGGSSSTTNPTGTQTYAAGAVVPISATAGSGYQFSSWSSTGSISFDASTSASTNALINSAGTIIANFIVPQSGQNYQVTFTLGAGGASMNPTGTQSYASGSTVAVSTVPASGYQFSSWVSTGSISFDSTTSSSTNAHINSAGSITANFAAITTGQNYQVTFALSAGGASINPTGTKSYAAGSIVAITTTAASGYQFSSWTSSGTISFDAASSASTNAHIDSDGTITANFAAIQCIITVTQGTNGVIAPGTTAVNYGGSQTFTITPNTGFHVLDVNVDGSSKGAVTSWPFTNVQVAHTITASFASGTYHTITSSAGANGQISPSGSVQVLDGGTQTFTITPSSGYVVASLIVDGASAGYGQSYQFSNVVGDHSIAVTFIQGSTLINTGFDGNTWDQGFMAGGNPPWYVATGQGIGGTNAAKSDPNGGNSGPFSSDTLNTQNANTIQITFMYKVLNTDSANDLRIAYSYVRNPNLGGNSPDFHYISPGIGRPALDNTWYVGSLTLTRASTPSAFTQYFVFRFESSLSTHTSGLQEQVWVDNVIITLS